MMRQTRPAVIMRPRRRRRFNWAIMAVPAAVLTAMWVASSIRIGFSWDYLLTLWGIKHRERFSQMASFGLVCVAIVAIARILRPERKDKD